MSLSTLVDTVDACGLTFDYVGGLEVSPVGAVWTDECGGLALQLLHDAAGDDWAQGALDTLGWTLDGVDEGEYGPNAGFVVPIELAQAVLDQYPTEVVEAVREAIR